LNNRYNSINALLLRSFGERVFKVSLESGCGCPNRDAASGRPGCSFCRPESLQPDTSPERDAAPRPIREQLDEGISYIERRHRAFRVIAYFQGGSSTAAAPSVLEPIFSEAISHPAVVGLAVSTRPDCIEEGHADLLERLSEKTMLWAELGLQSAHDSTLQRIRRGHDADCFARACALLQGRGIPVCAHVILGLPGETRGMMLETAEFLNRVGAWGVKIHNLHVLKGTALAEEFEAGLVPVPSLSEYASLACDFLERLSPSIVVHRVSGHGPRRLTLAPGWSVNNLAVMNAVHSELASRDSWQGKRYRHEITDKHEILNPKL
jgi:radical SAM protein (TIGR01212 family)